MEEKKVYNNSTILKSLSELINIPSYGIIDRKHLIIEYLKFQFKDCYEVLELNDKNGNTHLLVGVNCELNNLQDTILLSGHIDTVQEHLQQVIKKLSAPLDSRGGYIIIKT